MGIEAKVREFIIDTFLFGEDRGLRDNTSFIEGGIIDSTGVMELVAFLEQTFFVTIADDELVPDNLDSLLKVTAFMGRKAGCASAA
jgi:acyl carrier protein